MRPAREGPACLGSSLQLAGARAHATRASAPPPCPTQHLSTLQRCGRRRQCSRAMMLDKYVEAAAMDPRIRQHYERWKRGNQGGGGGGGRALEIEMAARRGAG